MNLHLFGAATPTGEAVRQLLASDPSPWLLHSYSRQPRCADDTHWADLANPEGFQPAGPAGAPGVWISLAPIWLLAPFLAQLTRRHPARLEGLRGVIACSSSSAITKRFAANDFDRGLVARLKAAEDQVLATCLDLAIPCRILRPTLIYGQVGAFGDHNLSRLVRLMRRLPVLPLPAHTGLRQPIHARQLAGVALELARQLSGQGPQVDPPPHPEQERIAIGGDDELTYAAMLRALQQALPAADPAHRCCLIAIPSRCFFTLATPLLLLSPKTFEAVLRIGADLAGFTPSHCLLDESPQPFPLLPLA